MGQPAQLRVDCPHAGRVRDARPGTAPAGQTHFRGFAGKDAFFDGVRGTTIPEITDGTSNTIALAVAREPAVWTRPGELPYVAGKSLSPLDTSNSGGYTIAMADGSVRSLAKGDAKLLPWLVTRNGGEVIAWERVGAAATTATLPQGFAQAPPTAVARARGQDPSGGGYLTGVATAPAPTPAPVSRGVARDDAGSTKAIERRLAIVEEKLDVLIRKLDAALRDGETRRRSDVNP